MAHFSRRLAAAAFITALALPVLAQTAAPVAAGENSATATSTPSATQQRQARDPARMQQRMQKRMDQLKAQLKLAPAQEGAWTDFTKAMQTRMQPNGNQRQEMAALTTPERIDRMRALRTERMAEADRRGEATKTFYATLTPEQQKTFDAHTHRQHRKDGHRGGHHGMR